MLKIRNVEKIFKTAGKEREIRYPDYVFQDGGYYCITGKSGCGKTTLLNIVTGMLPPDGGEVLLNEKNIYSMTEKERTMLKGCKLGYLSCGNSLFENLTVLDNLKYTLKLNGKAFDKGRVLECLKNLGIYGIRKSYPSEISSGEYKRVCFARVLILDTDILVLDEPTSNLDTESADVIIQAVEECRKQGKTILIATHDEKLIHGNILTLFGDITVT